MILALMRRSARVLLLLLPALVAAACGTQKLDVPRNPSDIYHGAVLFSQRCSGCHTLSYAATHGSAANVRTAQYNNGPNFDVRCERPAARVLYAIENGGFSGAIMPQNVVVGQDAIDVAKFVATYAGRQAPIIPGAATCDKAHPTIDPITPPPIPVATTTTAAATTTPAKKTPATKHAHPAAKAKSKHP